MADAPQESRLATIIKGFALACVAVTSTFIMAMLVWLTYLLQSDWCGRAIGAAKQSDSRPEYAVGGCFALLNAQVRALALNSLIGIGVIALCLLVLMVIVVAGGRLALKAGKDGIDTQISGDAIKDGDQVVVTKSETKDEP